jgi:quinoprotein glucose dehydrogenase
LLCLLLARAGRGADQGWPVYLGDHDNTHFSTLKQINRRNVSRLEVAWVYHCGDAQADRTQIQCNPLVVDGVIYATSPRLKALALDAATGRERWRFDKH